MVVVNVGPQILRGRDNDGADGTDGTFVLALETVVFLACRYRLLTTVKENILSCRTTRILLVFFFFIIELSISRGSE